MGNENITLEEVASDLKKRDLQDSSRSFAPLIIPNGAVYIDTSNMSLDEAVLTYPELEDRLFYGLPISDDEYLLVREKAGLSNKHGIYSLW